MRNGSMASYLIGKYVDELWDIILKTQLDPLTYTRYEDEQNFLSKTSHYCDLSLIIMLLNF